MTIALVTDSASMLPPLWRTQRNVLVAPMSVVLDGTAFPEGGGLSNAEFYRRLAAGSAVSTSAPSPGEILDCYERATQAGASAIVSIHTGGEYSAVLDAARVAARSVDLPVEFVDTGTVSFPVALCVAVAADARDAGGATTHVADAARAAAGEVDSIFVVGVPELAQRGGRLADAGSELAPTTILTLGPTGLDEHGNAADIDDTLDRMAGHLRRVARHRSLRVAVGDIMRGASLQPQRGTGASATTSPPSREFAIARPVPHSR